MFAKVEKAFYVVGLVGVALLVVLYVQAMVHLYPLLTTEERLRILGLNIFGLVLMLAVIVYSVRYTLRQRRRHPGKQLRLFK